MVRLRAVAACGMSSALSWRRRFRGMAALAWIALVACGGAAESEQSARSDDGGSSGSGGVTSVGGSGGGASGGSAGGGSASGGTVAATGGAAPDPCQFDGTVNCVEDCFSEGGFVLPVCEDSEQTCPDGATERSSCPEDSCAAAPQYCCDGVTGEQTENPCEEDGLRAPCQSPARAGGEAWCIPDLLDVEECGELEGEPCAGSARFCRSAGPLETQCSCTDGLGTWSCVYSAGL